MTTKQHEPQAFDLYRRGNGVVYLVIATTPTTLRYLEAGEDCIELQDRGYMAWDTFLGNVLALPKMAEALKRIKDMGFEDGTQPLRNAVEIACFPLRDAGLLEPEKGGQPT